MNSIIVINVFFSLLFLSQNTSLSSAYIVGVAGENLALGKPTFQSDVHNIGWSDNAVDGDKNAVYTDGSCTETYLGVNPWWAVDLGSSYTLDMVVITNRLDCCGTIKTLKYKIMEGDKSSNIFCPRT